MPVARRSRNPVVAPIKRWLYYSWQRFALVLGGLVALAGIYGAVFNPFEFEPTAAEASASAAAAAKTVTVKAGAEVTANQVLGMPSAEATKSAQVTAMKFVIAYINIGPATGEWLRGLSPYTDSSSISSDFVATRPSYPVTTSGQTLTDSSGPTVTVNTSAGKLKMSMGKRQDGSWIVLGPLPQLSAGASALGATAPPPVPAAPATSSAPPTVTVTVSASSSPAAPPAENGRPAPPPAPPVRPAAPVVTTTPPRPAPAPPAPRPGAIPIPSGLDGPLPGG